MMNMTAADVKRNFENAFGQLGLTIDKLTSDQVQFIADCGRHMRGRCRSNSALVNWLNSVFPSIRAKMKPVTVERFGKVETFDALDIQPRG